MLLILDRLQTMYICFLLGRFYNDSYALYGIHFRHTGKQVINKTQISYCAIFPKKRIMRDTKGMIRIRYWEWASIMHFYDTIGILFIFSKRIHIFYFPQANISIWCTPINEKYAIILISCLTRNYIKLAE